MPNFRKHIDIRLLPSIVPDDRRNETISLIAPEISGRIEKLKTLIDASVIDQEFPSIREYFKPI